MELFENNYILNLSADPHVNVLVKTHVKRKYSVHELFGFDVILDENLKPWIVEVSYNMLGRQFFIF